MLLEEIGMDNNEQPEYKIYCDLDGVLADFVKGVREILKLAHDEVRYEADPKYRKEMWKAVAEYSEAGGKLWGELCQHIIACKFFHYVQEVL